MLTIKVIFIVLSRALHQNLANRLIRTTWVWFNQVLIGRGLETQANNANRPLRARLKTNTVYRNHRCEITKTVITLVEMCLWRIQSLPMSS